MVGFTPGVVPGSLRSEVVLYQCAEYPEPLKIQISVHVQKHSRKPPSPVLQSSTLLIQQGCSTIASVNYLWFDVTTTLCYPIYPFGFVPYTSQVQILFSTHPSRCHKPLIQPVDNVKINLQSPPLNPQKPRKSQQQLLCFTRSNIALQ